MFMCICATVYACKYICACVWGWWGELYVCEYCMHIKKEAVGMNQELHMWKHFEQKQFP